MYYSVLDAVLHLSLIFRCFTGVGKCDVVVVADQGAFTFLFMRQEFEYQVVMDVLHEPLSKCKGNPIPSTEREPPALTGGLGSGHYIYESRKKEVSYGTSRDIACE